MANYKSSDPGCHNSLLETICVHGGALTFVNWAIKLLLQMDIT